MPFDTPGVAPGSTRIKRRLDLDKPVEDHPVVAFAMGS
jgi:hypothetical protein